MSNRVFPTLPGLQWDITKSPTWKTIIHTSVSGHETRAALMQYPTWKIELQYEFLRSGAQEELQALIGLFNLSRGSFDNFLFKDLSDYNNADQLIGVGDGIETDFQLIRNYAGFVEPVQNPSNNVVIKVNDIEVTTPADYLLSSTGVVQFTDPPANGDQITWSGDFYYRVRFEKDATEYTQFMKDLWSCKKLNLIGSPMNKV